METECIGDIVPQLAAAQVPTDFNKLEQQASLQKMGITKPINIAFRQEMDVIQVDAKHAAAKLERLAPYCACESRVLTAHAEGSILGRGNRACATRRHTPAWAACAGVCTILGLADILIDRLIL